MLFQCVKVELSTKRTWKSSIDPCSACEGEKLLKALEAMQWKGESVFHTTICLTLCPHIVFLIFPGT